MRLSSQANRAGGNQSNLANPSNLLDWTHDDDDVDEDDDDVDVDEDDDDDDYENVDEDDDDVEGNLANLANWTHPSETA